MSLNIKDPAAHRLAQAVAKATGETMTRAVTIALSPVTVTTISGADMVVKSTLPW